MHQRKTDGRGGGGHTHAGELGADTHRHRGMLGFNADITGIDSAVGHTVREMLRNGALRGDGVGGDNAGSGKADGLHSRAVAVKHLYRHQFSPLSSTSLSAFFGHSFTQMPQPLQ